MYPHKYSTFSIKEEDLNFRQFHITARYTITADVKCENLYNFSKKNNFSFFNLSVAAIYKTLEDIPELKKYIVDGECREYEQTNVVIPLIREDHLTNDICIESIRDFKSFKEWNDFLKGIKENPESHQHIFTPDTNEMPFAILSCLPWIRYTGFIDMPTDSDTYFPIVHWGKYDDGKVPVTLTSNHTFVYGYHLGLFFNKLEEYMNNPTLIFESIE